MFFLVTKSQTSPKRIIFPPSLLKIREMYNLDFGLQGLSKILYLYWYYVFWTFSEMFFTFNYSQVEVLVFTVVRFVL